MHESNTLCRITAPVEPLEVFPSESAAKKFGRGIFTAAETERRCGVVKCMRLAEFIDRDGFRITGWSESYFSGAGIPKGRLRQLASAGRHAQRIQDHVPEEIFDTMTERHLRPLMGVSPVKAADVIDAALEEARQDAQHLAERLQNENDEADRAGVDKPHRNTQVLVKLKPKHVQNAAAPFKPPPAGRNVVDPAAELVGLLRQCELAAEAWAGHARAPLTRLKQLIKDTLIEVRECRGRSAKGGD